MPVNKTDLSSHVKNKLHKISTTSLIYWRVLFLINRQSSIENLSKTEVEVISKIRRRLTARRFTYGGSWVKKACPACPVPN